MMVLESDPLRHTVRHAIETVYISVYETVYIPVSDLISDLIHRPGYFWGSHPVLAPILIAVVVVILTGLTLVTGPSDLEYQTTTKLNGRNIYVASEDNSSATSVSPSHTHVPNIRKVGYMSRSQNGHMVYGEGQSIMHDVDDASDNDDCTVWKPELDRYVYVKDPVPLHEYTRGKISAYTTTMVEDLMKTDEWKTHLRSKKYKMDGFNWQKREQYKNCCLSPASADRGESPSFY